MVWGHGVVQTLAGVDFVGCAFPKAQAKAKAKSKSRGAEDEAVETKVRVPVLVNCVALTEGTDLFFYKAAAGKRARAAEPISMSKLAKIVRT